MPLIFMAFVSIAFTRMGNKATEDDKKVHFRVIRNKQLFFTILEVIG